jgi:[ribosomal protein S5]-alanine N-acetyltransferase
MTIIKTKDFILRHATISDLDDYFYGQQDDLIKKNFVTPTTKFSDAKKELIESIRNYKKNKPSGEDFVIEVNGKFAGMIGIHEITYDPWSRHMAKIDFWLKKEYRGKGIMPKAARVIAEYGFKKYKLVRIQASSRTYNKGSLKALEKAGFKFEGVLRKYVCKDGKYYDNAMFSMVK